MTRKDYIALAAALKAAKPADYLTNSTARTTWYLAVGHVATALSNDNSRFDRGRFFDACGVPD